MKKDFLLSLAFMLIAANADAKLYTATEDLKVRADSRAHSSVLGVIKSGMQIDVDADNTSWGKVKYHDKTGYVKTRYLKAIPLSPPIAEETTNGPVSQNTILFSIIAVLGLVVVWKLFRKGSPARNNKSKSGAKNKFSLPLFWYQCKHCKAVVKNGTEPSNGGCLKSKLHHWTELAEVGIDNYFCKHCLTTIKANAMPAATGCPGGEHHIWVHR